MPDIATDVGEIGAHPRQQLVRPFDRSAQGREMDEDGDREREQGEQRGDDEKCFHGRLVAWGWNTKDARTSREMPEPAPPDAHQRLVRGVREPVRFVVVRMLHPGGPLGRSRRRFAPPDRPAGLFRDFDREQGR